MKHDTVVILLSGLGRGAVATVLLDGPHATKLVATFFTARSFQDVTECRENQIYLGLWNSGGGAEELVICRTSNTRFEIHCHGGRAAARQILDDLVVAGAREISSDQWLSRTEPSRLMREAKMLLPEARTERTLAILLDQVRGALRHQLEKIYERIEKGRLAEAKAYLDRILSFRTLGMHLCKPFHVVVIGPPNAGKSSLINALLGYQRSVVFDQPGTTRDTVAASMAIDGWPFAITDTAGIRQSNDPIETEGVSRALQVLRRADLALCVNDLTNAEHSNVEVIDLPAELARLQIGTKRDLVSPPWPSYDVLTSAATGIGIPELLAGIVQELIPVVPSQGDGIPLSHGTADVLEMCRKHLEKNQTREAQAALSSLLSG